MTSPADHMAKISEHEENLSELEGEVDTPDQSQVSRIKRKIDLRICLVLGVLYTTSLVDRVNLPVSTIPALAAFKNRGLKKNRMRMSIQWPHPQNTKPDNQKVMSLE